MLIIAETHPVQYHAPVWRECVRQGLPVHVIYGSDFSVAGAQDAGFGVSVKWDCDLLSGYESTFLSTVAGGGAKNYSEAYTTGLKEAILGKKASALLILGYASRFDRSARAIGSSLNLPLILRAETSDLGIRSWVKSAIRTLYLKALYTKFSAFNPIGTMSRQHYERIGVPETKLFESPYCVDESNFDLTDAAHARFRVQSRQVFGANIGDTVLLFSGKLIAVKAPEMLLRAVNALPPLAKNKIVVVFLGDGVLREALKQEAQALGVRAHFLGFQNQSKLSSFYHGADILSLPSRTNETWGLVVNEALMHGLPVLVSNTVGSAADLVNAKTGSVFERDNQLSLNAVLRDMLGRLTQFNRADCINHVANFSVARAAAGVIAAWRHTQSRN